MRIPSLFRITTLCLSLCIGGTFGFTCSAQVGAVISKNKPIRTKNSKKKASKPTLDTKSLALKITRGKTSEAAKAEAIFLWLATHISYDNELRLNKSLQQKIYTSEENVMYHALQRKKALCGGYAFLYKQLCAEVGIKASVIHGTTQKYQATPSKNTPDHTWNGVYLNGKWHLLDITWAVSHGSLKNPQRFWYLTNPSDFMKTHFPKEQKWRLISKSISK